MSNHSRSSKEGLGLSMLGLEITVPGKSAASHKSDDDLPASSMPTPAELGYGEEGEPCKSLTGQEGIEMDNALSHPSSADLGYGDEADLASGPYIHSVEPDEVSEYSMDEDDEDVSDDDDTVSYTTGSGGGCWHSKKPLPKRTYGTPALPTPEELGYGTHEEDRAMPLDSMPSRDQLGYGNHNGGPTRAELGYDDHKDEQAQQQPQTVTDRRTSIGLLSVGRQIRNRRSLSMGGARRFSNISGLSTVSSKSGSRKMRRAHSKSRGPSHRERMVERRMSYQYPSQIQVGTTTPQRRALSLHHHHRATSCDNYLQQEEAYRETLQDLGCSELVMDRRPSCGRAPRRVSLDYGPASVYGDDSVASSCIPRKVELEFGDDSNQTLTSMGGSTRSRRPRRISLSFDQQICPSQDINKCDDNAEEAFEENVSRNRRRVSITENNRKNARTMKLSPPPPARVIRRRGSLDFSLGTSCLPRRGSVGKEKASSTTTQHEHTNTLRKTTSNPTVFSHASSCHHRRVSLGGYPFRSSTNTAPPVLIHQNTNSRRPSAVSTTSRGCQRENSNSTSTVTSSNSYRRLSLSQIPSKTIHQLDHAVKQQLIKKQVGTVEYLTRETLMGRVA